MTSVTELYSISYNLAMCEVWLASCFVIVALGFTEIMMAVIFLSGDELLVGQTVENLPTSPNSEYYWKSWQYRILFINS